MSDPVIHLSRSLLDRLAVVLGPDQSIDGWLDGAVELRLDLKDGRGVQAARWRCCLASSRTRRAVPMSMTSGGKSAGAGLSRCDGLPVARRASWSRRSPHTSRIATCDSLGCDLWLAIPDPHRTPGSLVRPAPQEQARTVINSLSSWRCGGQSAWGVRARLFGFEYQFPPPKRNSRHPVGPPCTRGWRPQGGRRTRSTRSAPGSPYQRLHQVAPRHGC